MEMRNERRRWVWIAVLVAAGALGCTQAPAKVDVKELERQQNDTMKMVHEQERLERLEQQKLKAAEKASAKP